MQWKTNYSNWFRDQSLFRHNFGFLSQCLSINANILWISNITYSRNIIIMLWKKESNKGNALFTDLFALNGGEANFLANSRRLRGRQHEPVKNEEESLQKQTLWIWSMGWCIGVVQWKFVFGQKKRSEHVQIVENNSVQGCVENKGQTVTCYNHIGLIEKYFKHSCAPNVITCEGDGNHVFITVRPIKKGEHLSFPYFMFLLESKQMRQQILWERKRMVCRCTRCQGISATMEQRKQMA